MVATTVQTNMIDENKNVVHLPLNADDGERGAGDKGAENLKVARGATEPARIDPLADDGAGVGGGHGHEDQHYVGDGQRVEVLANAARGGAAVQLHEDDCAVAGQREDGREDVQEEDKVTGKGGGDLFDARWGVAGLRRREKGKIWAGEV